MKTYNKAIIIKMAVNQIAIDTFITITTYEQTHLPENMIEEMTR